MVTEANNDKNQQIANQINKLIDLKTIKHYNVMDCLNLHSPELKLEACLNTQLKESYQK